MSRPLAGRVTRPARRLRAARSEVHAALLDAVEIARYQVKRWSRDAAIGYPPDGPAVHAHAWRALADDADTLIELLTRVRDTARAEQFHLEGLSTDDAPARDPRRTGGGEPVPGR